MTEVQGRAVSLAKEEIEDSYILSRKDKMQWAVIAIIASLIICTIGGLLYQFYGEIGDFSLSLEHNLINFYQNSPPFVQGFLVTAAIIIVLVLIAFLLTMITAL